MSQIKVKDLAYSIKKVANEKGDLVRPDGSYYNSDTLAVKISLDDPYRPDNDGKVFRGGSIRMYSNRISSLITEKYIRVNYYPSRLTLTDKFSSLLEA